ncbi:MAG: UV DNA damage repair endonuclease UvsE, partial [Parachlamydiales bacterium]
FALLSHIKNFAKEKNLRLTLHPDQFVVLNSPKKTVVKNAVLELEYHNYLAELFGADVINIHAGGAYQNKTKALLALEKNLSLLSASLRRKLSLENDDRSFTPKDLLPFCHSNQLPFVYDVHHHRCLKDGLTEETATQNALKTWDREPLFHLSSPKGGWKSANPRLHADYLQTSDFPKAWSAIPSLTIELEAKAKELAVLDFMNQLKTTRIIPESHFSEKPQIK